MTMNPTPDLLGILRLYLILKFFKQLRLKFPPDFSAIYSEREPAECAYFNSGYPL